MMLGGKERRMAWFAAKGALDRTFQVSIILKGLDGVLELAGGVLLLAVSPATINRLVATLTQHERSEDPHDAIATHLVDASQRLTGSAVMFVAIYLLAHGLVKVVLVTALLREQLWAYPWTIAVLLAFVAYQLYRIALRPPSWGLIALTVFDLIVAWLTWREYQKRRTRRP
jgi:uncharacterized membrane protein